MQRELAQGYINSGDFLKCGDEIRTILETLPELKPFSMLDINGERGRISDLFIEDNAGCITDYFCRRAVSAQMDAGAAALGVLPKQYDKAIFAHAQALLADVKAALTFYDSISEDMESAFKKLTLFAGRTDEADRTDEAHLLPIAAEVFGQISFPYRRNMLLSAGRGTAKH